MLIDGRGILLDARDKEFDRGLDCGENFLAKGGELIHLQAGFEAMQYRIKIGMSWK